MKDHDLPRDERREWIRTLRRQFPTMSSEEIGSLVGTTKGGVDRVLLRAMKKDPSLRKRQPRLSREELQRGRDLVQQLNMLGDSISEEEYIQALHNLGGPWKERRIDLRDTNNLGIRIPGGKENSRRWKRR